MLWQYETWKCNESLTEYDLTTVAYSGNTAEACVFYLTSLFPFSAQHESLIFSKISQVDWIGLPV